jgi:hypothetical protein
MEKSDYDCAHTCLSCGGKNKLVKPYYELHTLHESETECTKCGHVNYWAHGWYQYDTGDLNE